MTNLVRLPDWPERLSALLAERRSLPYRYGSNDCASLCHDAVLAITGTDLLEGVDRPTSWLGAAKFLISRGWDDVEAMATDLLGSPLRFTSAAQRGDIVSFEALDERHLGVCTGESAATPGASGLVFVPMARWLRAWKVG